MKKAVLAILIAALITSVAACSARRTEDDRISTQDEELSQSEKNQLEVTALVEQIAQSPAVSSSVSDYIAEHREQFDAIVQMGDDGLAALFGIFEKGGQTGLEGRIMQSACEYILGGETIGLETDTAQQWYDAFKRHVIRIANLNSVDFIRQNSPKSYVLLQTLDFENKGYDSSKFLEDAEIEAMSVYPGMTYEQAIQIIGQPDEEFNNTDDVKSVIKDGVHYGFYKINDSFDKNFGLPHDQNFYLLNFSISGDSEGPRKIKVGDDIQDVFIKFPVKNTSLQKWAAQKIYGPQRTGEPHATLRFTTVLGTYDMVFVTEKYSVLIDFDKQNKVRTIDISWE